MKFISHVELAKLVLFYYRRGSNGSFFIGGNKCEGQDYFTNEVKAFVDNIRAFHHRGIVIGFSFYP